jgi:hypothetical protein
MERRKLAAMVVAIAAATVLVGAGVTRCSMSLADGSAGQGAAVEAEQAGESAAQADDGAGRPEETEDPSPTGADALWNTSWEGKDDPTATLNVANGVMVERTGGSDRAVFFISGNETEKDGALTLEIQVTGEGGGLSLIQVAEASDGGKVLTCDKLSQAYVPQKASATEFELSGADKRLAEALGASTDDIRGAIAAQAKKVSPYATKATWDKEVWIDYGGGRASATFTLNDAASTVVTVLASSDGEIEAM